ncbi:MAG: hypothetical protein WC513_09100 [Bacteroidales bacterium]|jgi:hypothetical protein|nr:hypothetical protein [Bacteroidales bacterium]MDD2830902.1 hypothetical protein [Bacteroidales bacterium]MDD3208290.1 hypothetical protein [Bacteroidales bacterium]MDD3696668.1 hypothetical protein [Bacteroidales bacterium]MDD4166969.1 hypothetical protein [Bacteroidales bacterium]
MFARTIENNNAKCRSLEASFFISQYFKDEREFQAIIETFFMTPSMGATTIVPSAAERNKASKFNSSPMYCCGLYMIPSPADDPQIGHKA